MPTIVYLVHGMGCGTADGKPQAAGTDWSAGAIAAFTWLCKTFKLPTPSVVGPNDTSPPANPAGVTDANAIWVAPLSYYSIFDEFRSSSQSRAALAKGVTAALSDADITKLTSTDFAWVNCLDVLLWWADDVQTNNRTTATLGKGITAINQLAAQVAGATTRRIMVSHSLGTAATTGALLDLATNQVWTNSTGFEAWFTLANVAPFVLEQAEVYSGSLLPDGPQSLIQSYMYNARNACDPVPWLLPWRAFSPSNAGGATADWQGAQGQGYYAEVDTQDVAGLQGSTLDITGVHGFTNYMLNPSIALPLASHVRGSGFTPQEQTAINYQGAWNALPHLRCQNDAGAFADLKTAVAQYTKNGPSATGGNPKVDWITRLLDGVELLLAAQKKC